ncbi:MAG: hypothetical protein LBE79_12840 [Tannerella sp.]|jgi:hypothetical protein|nr:hypothetical protein [Tannerella sp.]
MKPKKVRQNLTFFVVEANPYQNTANPYYTADYKPFYLQLCIISYFDKAQ